MKNRDGHRMKFAVGAVATGLVECQAIAQKDASMTEDLGEKIVGRHLEPCGIRLLDFQTIRFRENDVETYDGRPHVTQPRDQLANHVSTPRPLAECKQAALVDVDNDDAFAWRLDAAGAHDH